MDSEQQLFCVVIPAYMEAAKVADVVAQCQEQCPLVIVVDDGSSDATAEVAESAGAVVLRQDKNQGKGVALTRGFEYAAGRGCEALVTLDADGQHLPEEIAVFFEEYKKSGTPVLVGNRMEDQSRMPLVRRWTNSYMSWVLSRAMGQRVPDTQCGYRLYRCDIIPHVNATCDGFAAESEILLHISAQGYKIGSVPISTVYAGDENSKIHPIKDTVRFFKMLRDFKRQAKLSKKDS